MLKRADIERFIALTEEAKELRRRASTLSKEADEIGEQIADFVREKGGPDKTCRRHGFVLALQNGRGSVPWKQEFVKIAGDDVAELLIQSAPVKEILCVTPEEEKQKVPA